MRRRDFVKTLPALPAGLGCATLLSAGCAGTTWLVPTRGPGTLSVPVADATATPWVLVEWTGSSRPILLRRDDGGEWLALHAQCTHRGCQPEPVGAHLVCPCHGSEFSLTGQVLNGPAERPLRRFPTRVEEGRVVIELDGRP